jgi:DNA-directed RNA polymerase subunit RPC12/RpoP
MGLEYKRTKKGMVINMKMFKCPYCSKESFTPKMKMNAGSMKKKGIKCPECGCHCVNGMPSTIFHTIVLTLSLGYMLLAFKLNIGSYSFQFFSSIFAILFGIVLMKLFDAFFGTLIKSLRLDI